MYLFGYNNTNSITFISGMKLTELDQLTRTEQFNIINGMDYSECCKLIIYCKTLLQNRELYDAVRVQLWKEKGPIDSKIVYDTKIWVSLKIIEILDNI